MSEHSFRAGLEFDVSALERYLLERLPGFRGPLRVTQFEGGQSNPTYRLDTDGRRLVLRRKPPGPLLPSAHAVDREYRVMKALCEKSSVPVARPHLLCEDRGVIGTEFYVMDFVEGRVFWDPALPEVEPADRRPLYEAMNETLATLHALDPSAIGLGDFGRPEGYVARQLHRWTKQYQADDVAGRDPVMDRLTEWLAANVPVREPAPAVVHGDFRLDNLVFHPTEPRVVAVMDWELSTIGDPLADFAYHLMAYRMSSASVRGLKGKDVRALGLPSEDEYVEAYCRRRGIPGVPHLDFYMAFCMFRLAAIFHGIKGRVARGTAVSPQARQYAAEFEGMARVGWEQTRSA